jgi:hypothetical protein
MGGKYTPCATFDAGKQNRTDYWLTSALPQFNSRSHPSLVNGCRRASGAPPRTRAGESRPRGRERLRPLPLAHGLVEGEDELLLLGLLGDVRQKAGSPSTSPSRSE